MLSETPPVRVVERVRHELKFRVLRAVEVEDLTPTLRRIVLEGDGLQDFVSLGFDDHIKLFPPQADGEVILPSQGPDGLVFADPRPPARDYTPRRYEPDSNRLTIDFVLGHGGPATDWAVNVALGNLVGVGGPRGSRVVSREYAVHILIGDETALPAIARRLEELPEGVRAIVVVEVDDAESCVPLETRARLDLTWAQRAGRRRGDPQVLIQAVEGLSNKIGTSDVYVWAAAEAEVARQLRASLVDQGFESAAMRVSGYWTLRPEMGGEPVSAVLV